MSSTPRTRTPRSRGPARVRVVALLAALMAGLLVLVPHGARADAGGTYTNAVSDSFADTFADPTVIQGKDGWYYAYATADPLREGDPSGIGHMARTRDWKTWEYLGTIFTAQNRPSWATATSNLWAPDVRYLGGRYVMYFTVTDTAAIAGDWDPAIGVATAPTPAGPWTPTDAPVVAPRYNPGSNNYFNTIDPAGFTDLDGNHYLYFGNYYGGVHVTRLSDDGLTAVGDLTQVGAWDRYEGSWVVEHDGWYYLMGSSANCCAGPATGYSVFSGRSRSPMGPFVDAEGLDLNASVTGGTTVVTQNGNRFIGPGHNASFTDLAGRDFLVYHALPRDDAWLTTPFGINERPMLIDRIDWVDGWPRVNAGAGPSDTAKPLPVTTSLLGLDVTNPVSGFTRLTAATDALSGAAGRLNGVASTTQVLPSGDLRVRMDLKGTLPVQVRLGKGGGQVLVTVDQGALTVKAADGSSSDTLKPDAHWRTLTLSIQGGTIVAEVASSDLRDASARVVLTSARMSVAGQPLTLNGNGLVDNVSVNQHAVEATTLAPQPAPTGTPLVNEQFSGSAPGANWHWVRPDAGTTVSNGSLNLPVRNVDLVGGTNTGALLLTDAPLDQDWIFETKVTLDLGEVSNRNYQQAGIVVRNTDDDFARLGTVSIWGTRTVEYGRELAAVPGDARTIYGGAIIGATAPTLWMRVAHHQNSAGEHLYRAAISRDGVHWVWGATWVLGADTAPQIGLYAGGGSSPTAVAQFDYATLTPATAPAGTWPR